jgi:hypothetical protein
MSKEKLIEIVDGIRITKPWNEDMYKHNDKVASEMKKNILFAVNDCYKNDDEDRLREIGKNVCAYGFGQGCDLDEIHNQICIELDRVENWWLNQEYPDMVKKGLVPATTINFVGYKK